MSSRLKLAGICFAAAFALAACGGGGGTTATMPPPPTEPPPPAGPTPSEQVSDLFAKVSKYEMQASDAQKAAEAALEDAGMKSGMLDAVSVKGESATAEDNAQAVLDAVGKVDMAVMDAENALMALNQAKMDAEAIPDDTANLAQLKTDIDNAIEAAEGNLEAAEGIRDNRGAGSLAALVAMIMGDNGKKTAAMWGMDVASSIQTGLNGWVVGDDHGTAAGTASATIKNPVSMNDAPANAMTFEEIVGTENFKPMPVGTTPTKMASLEGMTVASVKITGTIPEAGQPFATTAVTDADSDDNYMGILGSVYCLAATCKVEDGKLGAGWYFAPTNPVQQRYRHKVGVGYEVFNDYASYGYWVQVDADGNVDDVDDFKTFATGSHVADSAVAADATGISAEDIGDDEGKATYSGSAAGMSVVTVPNPAGADRVAGKSGAFTASVTLNATFGADPTVDGMITNFSGDAIGSGWSVTLRSQTLAAGGSTDGQTRTDGQAADGTWSAQPYGGSATARPSGIHGGFEANFRDGNAIGAYATRKD